MDSFEKAKEIDDYVIQMRRYFHENPEVSMQEYETLKVIKKELDKLNIEYEEVPDGGIIGTIEGSEVGKTLILRGDMDALPMQESPLNLKQEKEIVSKIDGAAHMCGHDAHTAMLLGAAKILKEKEDILFGKILFVFERAEEIGGGVFSLLQRLTEIGADGSWAIHLKNDLDAGKISVQSGPRMAAAFPFDVIIHGKSGHGSRPDLAASPVNCFIDFATKLNNMRLTSLNPFDPITYSIGSVAAGSAANVIPDQLQFLGTARYLQYEQGLEATRQFKTLLEQTCVMYNCQYEYVKEPVAKATFVYNHEQCADIATEAVRKTMGGETLSEFPAWMASEPFSFYQKYFPGVFAFLGVKNDALGTGAEHHNRHFDIDESSLKIGVTATVQYAIDFLNYDEDIQFEPESQPIEKVFSSLIPDNRQ